MSQDNGGQPGPRPATNRLAIAALAVGIGQVLLGPYAGLVGIAAFWLGVAAFGQIKASGERGRGLAATGLALGCLGMAVTAAVVVLLIGALRSG
jgi:hypothetical protein